MEQVLEGVLGFFPWLWLQGLRFKGSEVCQISGNPDHEGPIRCDVSGFRHRGPKGRFAMGGFK